METINMDKMIKDIKKVQKDGFIYLATPYTAHPGGFETSYQQSSRIAGWLVSKGVMVFCPIAHTHPIGLYGGLDPVDSDNIWMPLDLPFMKAAKALVVAQLPGWSKSKGIDIEICTFKKDKKKVFFLDPSLIDSEILSANNTLCTKLKNGNPSNSRTGFKNFIYSTII